MSESQNITISGNQTIINARLKNKTCLYCGKQLKKYDKSSFCSKEHDDLHNERPVTENSKDVLPNEVIEKEKNNDVQINLNLQKNDSNPIITLILLLSSIILLVSYFIFPTIGSFPLFEYSKSMPVLNVIPITGVIGVIINILIFLKLLKPNIGRIPLNSILGLIFLLIIILLISLGKSSSYFYSILVESTYKVSFDEYYGWWAMIGAALIMLIVGFFQLQNIQIRESENNS